MKKLQIEIEVEEKVAKEGSGFIAMAGWHQNYNDFTYGEDSCTITYINGSVTIIRGNKESFSINLHPLIEAVLGGSK